MEKKDIQDLDFADMILEKPVMFNVKGERFEITPFSLGKRLYMHRLYKNLFGENKINPLVILMTAKGNDKKMLSAIIAHSTAKNKNELFDTVEMDRRIQIFNRYLTSAEMTKILTIVMQQDQSQTYISTHHIDIELENMRKIQSVKKNDKNSISVGGKSIYGQIIDPLCERYGWTYDYVLWGVSFANIQLLLADSVKTMFLSDKERGRISLATGDFIDATKASDEEIDKALGLI